MAARRRFLNVSQRKLADAVGVHYMTIARMEQGRTTPSLHLVIAVARALGTPIHQLIEIEEVPGVTEEPLP